MDRARVHGNEIAGSGFDGASPAPRSLPARQHHPDPKPVMGMTREALRRAGLDRDGLSISDRPDGE